MSPEEQRLADLLKRVVPEPPRELTYEEITVPHVNRSRKTWLMPTLAAAAVVAIGVTLGAVATHHSGAGTVSYQPAASGASAPIQSASTPAASASPSDCAYSVLRSKVTVPNVTGQTAAQATAELQAAGLDVVVSQQSSTAPRGTVVGQSPPAGSRVTQGTAVTLHISNSTGNGNGPGPTPAPTPTCTVVPTPASTATEVPRTLKTLLVPSVIGQTAAQANATLHAAGLVTITMQAQRAPSSAGTVPAGVVWSQSPAAGTSVAPGATVTVLYQP